MSAGRRSDYVLVPSPEFCDLIESTKPAFARLPDADERARILEALRHHSRFCAVWTKGACSCSSDEQNITIRTETTEGAS